MVEAPGIIGIDLLPEVNFARRVIEIYDLQPPVNIVKLVKTYGELQHEEIPFDDIDGISLYLKVRGKKPHVIVNSAHHLIRRRFTIAHELGHIVIPWHVGTIIDHADPHAETSGGSYWQIEQEANTFAAEVLMPQRWVDLLLLEENNIAKVHSQIFNECETSALAAAIRLAKILPGHYVYASEKEGVVEFSGKTPLSLARVFDWGSPLPEDTDDYCKNHFINKTGSRTLHWWLLPDTIQIRKRDRREWRQVLDDILRDLSTPTSDAEQIKSSINGIVAAANGRLKGRDDYCVDTVATVCIQRLTGRAALKAFLKHKDFQLFVYKKAEDMVGKG